MRKEGYANLHNMRAIYMKVLALWGYSFGVFHFANFEKKNKKKTKIKNQN
jgi:hypothetical protein